MSTNEDYLEFKQHTKSKLKLLEYYISQWDYIVGIRRAKHFILDCMAGTGYNEIENKRVKGSALIACKRLQYKRNLEVFLIEKDKENFTKLQKSVKEYLLDDSIKDPNLMDKIHLLQQDCYGIMDSILKIIGNNKSLFIIDSYSAPTMNLIEKIGSKTLNVIPFRWGTEIFIFFNAPYINRHGSTCLNYEYDELIEKKNLTESENGAKKKIEEFNSIFGDNSWQNIFKTYYPDTKQIIIKLLTLYIEKLKKFFRFVIPLKVADSRGRLQYFFIFVTNHFEAFNMVFLKKNKIEIENTIIQYCNLGKKLDLVKNYRKILFKNLKKRINIEEKGLLSKILRYKTTFETDIFDQNLEKGLEGLLKKSANTIETLLTQLYNKGILIKKRCLYGKNIPFERFYIDPKLLKDPQMRLDSFNVEEKEVLTAQVKASYK